MEGVRAVGAEDVRREVEQERDSGRRWICSWAFVEGEQEVCAGQKMTGEGGGDGGAAVRRRRRRHREDGGEDPWPGQGVAAVVVAAAAARRRASAAAAVGLLPRPSLSSHLRGRSLISSSNDG